MRSIFKLGLMLAGAFIDAQELSFQSLEIHPIDFNDSGMIDAFPAHVEQMESADGKIYLRSKRDPFVTVINKNGDILAKIGEQGFGPGEIDRGILAIGLYRDHLWLQPVNKRDHLLHFEKGVYRETLGLDTDNPSMIGGLNSNAFVATPDAVVFPVSPRTGHLAKAYLSDNKTVWLGEIRFDGQDAELLRKIPSMNDTNWVFDGAFYYCLFRYYPLILKFNRDFQQIDTFDLALPYIKDLFLKRVMDWQPDSKIRNALPLFTDFKRKFGYLFVMTNKALIQIESTTGRIAHIYQFHGKGESFKNRKLNFFQFTILDDRTVVLSGIFAWGHDLWYATLPP